ncbi:LytTr DNA-binding domain-containing protein [Spirosomataceae bacterium TFI 002]|nr:LytTr DNA-binding domain-containing protein [Spirosomataceae bacterium TFI 002]
MTRTKYPESKEILCLQADVNYTIFHLIGGRKMISSSTLKRYVESPNFKSFLQINRGTLVNPNYIRKVISIGNQKHIILNNGQEVLVSRRRLTVLDNLKN